MVAIVVLWPTEGGLTPLRTALSAALMLAGEWYRLIAVGVAGKCTRTRGRNVKELVTSGPFAHVRNPLYVGNFILSYGLVVMSKVDWLLWAFPVAFFLQYAAIVAWEERILGETFGREYERYRAEVPAWIPTPRAFSTPSGHTFRREIALRSERDSLRAMVIIVAFLLAKHYYLHAPIGRLVRALTGGAH